MDVVLESHIVQSELVVKIVVEVLLSFGGVVNELREGRKEVSSRRRIELEQNEP